MTKAKTNRMNLRKSRSDDRPALYISNDNFRGGAIVRILNFINGIFQNSRRIEKPETATVDTQPKPLVYGSHGRLEIPRLLISVPLYDANGANKQRVVDDTDSAVYFRFGYQDAIADHSNQANFQNLNLAKPGMLAVIDQGETKTSYKLVQSQIGHIRISPLSNQLYDQDWNPVALQNAGGLCIYTCIRKSADDVMDVRLTYWQPVETRQ